MGLAANQEIEKKPEVREPWSIRRLFPMRATVSAIAKTFVSPLEILLAWVFLIVGVSVIFQRHISIAFYILALVLLLGVIFERAGTSKVSLPEKKK